MDVLLILPLVQVLFTVAIRRQTMNPVKTGSTYFQILPQATSRSHSDHTHLSVPQTRHASVALRIFAWPVPLAHNVFLPILYKADFYHSDDGSLTVTSGELSLAALRVPDYIL